MNLLLARLSLVTLLLFSLGCRAQSSAPSDLNARIEQHVRAQYNVPSQVEVKIGERKPSKEFSDYDEVIVTFSQGERKQELPFLLSRDGKSLFRVAKMDLTRDLQVEARKQAAETAAKIDISGRPIKGNPDAKVVIVNFDDFQCPYCKRMHDTLMKEILPTYKDRVKVVYKDFPLYTIHPWAIRASVNANCLAEQSGAAYWSFADYIHDRVGEISRRDMPIPDQMAKLDSIAMDQGKLQNVDGAKLQACIQKQDRSMVDASMKEANELGVEATPTLFINGVKIDGALPAAEVRAVIDEALRQQNQPIPGK